MRPNLMRRRANCIFMLGIAMPFAAYAQVNQAPDITLPAPTSNTTLGTPVSFAPVVSDPDVGNGLMELEIDISDLDGIGGLSAVNGDYGRFSWGLGTNLTTDVDLATRIQLNNALSNFTYTPRIGFAGVARLIFEIDDQGNTGTGGILSRTRFINIDVCAPTETGADCSTNNPPDITIPPAMTIPQGQSLAFAPSASDIDVGPGQMEMEIDIVDLDGVGGLSVTNGDYGRFSWGLGSNVTSDIELRTLSQLNNALASFVYTPPPGFTGMARIVFEIDDQGNSGNTISVLSRTRFINITVQADPGVVRFADGCTLTVGEGAQVAIPVERVNGNTGAASVQLQAQAGTALTPADFSFTTSQLSWGSTQTGLRSANLQIAADGISEATEFLTMQIANPTGAILGTPASQTIFIRDVAAAQLVFADSFEGNCN